MMSNQSLVNSLTEAGYLKTPGIIRAFLEVDRADFVGVTNKDVAYLNQPLPIGFGQTISQPLTVAMMLEWLVPKLGQKILDVGCGSGWTVALLSLIVGKKGKVIGIERISELVEFAKKNLARYPKFQFNSLVVTGDGSQGYRKEAPYDGIIAAAASSEIPTAWKEQLKIGGRIVAPVKDSIVVVDKTSKDEYRETVYWGFAFVPLISNFPSPKHGER